MYLLVGCIEKNKATLLIFPPKIHGQNLIMRTNQTNPNWGTFYILLGCNLNKYQDPEYQAKTEKPPDQETTAAWQLKATSDFGWGPFCHEGHYWDNWWKWNKVRGIDYRNVSVNILILMVAVCLYRRMSLFVGNTH